MNIGILISVMIAIIVGVSLLPVVTQSVAQATGNMATVANTVASVTDITNTGIPVPPIFPSWTIVMLAVGVSLLIILWYWSIKNRTKIEGWLK